MLARELKDRVFEALRLSVEGFISNPENNLDPSTDLPLCQSNSLVLLYRLLFVMYAEDRSLLPYRVNDIYTKNRSLARHRVEVATKLDNISRNIDKNDFRKDTLELWQDVKALFDLVDRGRHVYGVPAYNGGLFDLEENVFLTEKSLSDWYIARILDQLSRAPQPGSRDQGLFPVDYRDLAIQQLGSVYEGLLEVKPQFASEPMRLVASARAGVNSERIIPLAGPLPAGYQATKTVYSQGTIYLSTDKGERRSTGSYFTPDHIVLHIVEATLRPVCQDLTDVLEKEIKAVTDRLAAADPDEKRSSSGKTRRSSWQL